jgi:hypothetical protein
LSATLKVPGNNFNLPSVASASAAGISSADNTRLLSTINDLLGIPATLRQGFLGNQNTQSFSPLFSGDYLSLWAVGERQKHFNFYAQDEWRIRPNLTVTYGIRWEVNKAPTEVSQSPYVPNLPIDGSQGPVTFVKANSWYQGNNLGAFAPRIGVAWQPFGNGRTVVHAGYGIAFDPPATFQAAAVANTVPGQSYSCTATTYGAATATPGCATVSATARLSQGFPQQLPTPSVRPATGLSPTTQLLGVAPNVVVFDPSFKMATVHQWNINIQRDLGKGVVWQVGYVANRGQRLYSQLDRNQIDAAPILNSFTAMQANAGKGCNPSGTGACSGGATPVPLITNGIISAAFADSANSRTDLAQNAAGNFAGRIEQTTLAARLRPNQQFSSIIYLSNQADSVYHSLQTTLRKRFDAGFLINLGYTFGKAIDNQSGDPIGTSYAPTTSTAIDSRNLRLDRGRADFDRRHVLTVTGIYELPFGQGKPFLSSAHGILQSIVGGWSIQGFNSLQSGEPFSVTSGAKTSNFSAASSRAALAGAAPDASLKYTAATGPVFFTDSSAFTQPVPGFSGIGRNTFQGPWYWDVVAAVAKTFKPTEQITLNFRMEAFNAFNHANFRKLGSTSVGSTSILSTNFGTACCQTQSTSTSTAIVANGEAYRVVQFVAKISF